VPVPPVDPGYFDKVNYVIKSWTQPCEAPWYIYVETLFPALLEAFITLMLFGWDDVARGYFRPPQKRGSRHRRRGKKRKPRPLRIPEWGEEIGKRLPGSKKARGRKYSQAGLTLWAIDSALQRGLFWWLVADVTIDLAYNWTSLLYETEWCKGTAAGRFSYHTDELNVRPPNIFFNAHYNVEDYEFGPPFWLHTKGVTGAVPCHVSAAMQLKPTVGGVAPTAIQIRIVDDFTNLPYFNNGPNAPEDTNDVVVIVGGELPAFTAFRVQIYFEGSAQIHFEGAVTAQEMLDVP